MGGRPKGTVSGRQRGLLELDKLLNKPENIEKLVEAWQRQFDTSPAKFWDHVVIQGRLIPAEMTIKHTGDEKAVLRIELMKPSEKGKGESDGDT